MSSTASHGSPATVAGVTPVNAATRAGAQNRACDHRGQAHLHALDVFTPHPNRASEPEPEPGDATSPLLPPGGIFHDGLAGTELQDQCHGRVWDHPKRCHATDTEPSHADTGHPAGPDGLNKTIALVTPATTPPTPRPPPPPATTSANIYNCCGRTRPSGSFRVACCFEGRSLGGLMRFSL
jgi:hypothetical protein